MFLTFGVRLGIRTKLKTRREAHLPVGSGVSKKMKHLIDSELTRVSNIVLEPLLLDDNGEETTGRQWRHMAVDAVTTLNRELYTCKEDWFRPPFRSMKEHLEVLEKQSVEAEAMQEWVKLAQLYNKARFGHQEFMEDKYLEIKAIISNLRRLTVCLDSQDRLTDKSSSVVQLAIDDESSVARTFPVQPRYVSRRLSETPV
jgi:hypothetical protein